MTTDTRQTMTVADRRQLEDTIERAADILSSSDHDYDDWDNGIIYGENHRVIVRCLMDEEREPRVWEVYLNLGPENYQVYRREHAKSEPEIYRPGRWVEYLKDIIRANWQNAQVASAFHAANKDLSPFDAVNDAVIFDGIAAS